MHRIRKRGLKAVSFSLALLLFFSGYSFADEIQGLVVSVADGDTLTVLDASSKQHLVRLNGIDAPETRQAFSQVSKRNLSTLVFGKDVVVAWQKTDQYGRLVGTVRVGTTDTVLEQLRAGPAWYFRRYERDVAANLRPVYEAAEAEARAGKRGLWQDAEPQPPWAFRDGEPAPGVTAAAVIGNRNSKIYHVPGCDSYNDVAERNRVYFKTEPEAVAAGFRKARNCN
jgi:endonuclease YncB( thermonuclease family)